MLVIDIMVIVCVLILLLAFIMLSAYKLSIYFNTFMFLSKKINYDKANYISNSSFFKYYYANKMFFGMFGIEFLITVILVAMTLTAYAGYVKTNHINFGYLNNNYGDPVEYSFVNFFIYTIIGLAVIYGGAYMYWFNYDKDGDDKLYASEAHLKTTLIEHLDYKLLYDYYKKTTTEGKYELDTYNLNMKAVASNYFETPSNAFNYSLTYYILNDAKFTLIKSDIFDIIKNIPAILDKKGAELDKDEGANIERIKKAIADKADFYIIARYNHNNNIALRPLNALIYDLIKLMKTDTANAAANASHIANLEATLNKMKEFNEPAIKDMMGDYDNTQDTFMTTIKLYKDVYDNYYMYYMYSVLLTNFVIIYAVLVFIYILIKIGVSLNGDFDDNWFNIYNFTGYLNNYGLYLLAIYYFISCPIILFGFN